MHSLTFPLPERVLGVQTLSCLCGRLSMLVIRDVFHAIPVIPATFGAITKLGLGVRPLGDATDGAGMERLIALDQLLCLRPHVFTCVADAQKDFTAEE